MKNQALFSSIDNNKKSKCRLLQFLFGALRVSIVILPLEDLVVLLQACHSVSLMVSYCDQSLSVFCALSTFCFKRLLLQTR